MDFADMPMAMPIGIDPPLSDSPYATDMLGQSSSDR
jgi:hypothetical protein